MHSVGFNKPDAAPASRILCDDEEVTLDVGGVNFKALVGSLRRSPKLAATFPEAPVKVPASGVFQIERSVAAQFQKKKKGQTKARRVVFCVR
jgi:hypothetical protein